MAQSHIIEARSDDMNRIKECRIPPKLSQKFVAVTLGVTAPSVSNWESGKTQLTPEISGGSLLSLV